MNNIRKEQENKNCELRFQICSNTNSLQDKGKLHQKDKRKNEIQLFFVSIEQDDKKIKNQTIGITQISKKSIHQKPKKYSKIKTFKHPFSIPSNPKAALLKRYFYDKNPTPARLLSPIPSPKQEQPNTET